MTALKWITTEAKKLRKQYPKRFATWREYVAQASAIYASKHKGKSPVGKKRKVGAVKKAAKKSPAKSEYHKDTKSHNVNIRVMSGYAETQKNKALDAWKAVFGRLAAEYVSAKTKKEKNAIVKEMKIAKQMIVNFSK